jgi:hypothetical protein
MTTAYDPIVARALDRLVAGAESDPDEILRRARAAAEPLRRRRTVRLRIAVLGFALLVLLAGAALAGSRFDVFPWLDQSDRSSATFSIDQSQTYRGPAPDVLVCPQARPGSFGCSVGGFPTSNRRAYFLADRVEAQPPVSRDFYLRQLAVDERAGRLDRATAERIRRDVDAVGDDFFSALALLAGVETVGGGEQAPGRPGFELVPPTGVPMWISCMSSGDGFRCRDLSSSRDVPVGTPLYFLHASSDWVAVPRHSQRPIDVRRLFHAVLGRELKSAEIRLLVDLATYGSSEGKSSSRASTIRPKRVSP